MVLLGTVCFCLKHSKEVVALHYTVGKFSTFPLLFFFHFAVIFRYCIHGSFHTRTINYDKESFNTVTISSSIQKLCNHEHDKTFHIKTDYNRYIFSLIYFNVPHIVTRIPVCISHMAHLHLHTGKSYFTHTAFKL